MQQIIDGKRYDTDKATLIGDSDYGHCGDLDWWETGLYRTPKSKRYFLAGSGGARSIWAYSPEPNRWSGGSGVIPMTDKEAFDWAQTHLTTDDVEAQFGDLIEDA